MIRKKSVALVLLSTSICACFAYPPSAYATHDDVVRLSNEGVSALRDNNWALAIQKFQECLKLEPNYKLPRQNMGTCYNNWGTQLLNKPQQAIEKFHKAVFYDPSNPVTVQNLQGIIRALGKDPKSFNDRLTLGKQARLAGDFEGATVEFAEALKIKEDPQVRSDLSEVQVLASFSTAREDSEKQSSNLPLQPSVSPANKITQSNIDGFAGLRDSRTYTADASSAQSHPTLSNEESPAQRQQRIREQAEKIAAARLAKKQADDSEALRLADQLYAERAKQRENTSQSIATTTHPYASPNKQSLNNGSTDRPVRDKWAVIVGVGKFQDPTIPKLHYPAKDAQDFYNFLITKANFRPDHVRLLLDEKATKKRIDSEIGDKFLPYVVGPDDLVVVYFATHGSPAEKDVRGDSYLVAYDTEKTELWSGGIDMPKLLGTLQDRTHADRILIVLDACHSGAADPNARGLDFQSAIDIDKFSIGRGNIILTSSQPDEISWESTQYPNGIFTKRLIDCLTKNPSIIKSFPELKNSVANDVRHEFGKFQTPHIKADGWEGKDLLINAPVTGSAPLPESVKAKLQPDSTVPLTVQP